LRAPGSATRTIEKSLVPPPKSADQQRGRPGQPRREAERRTERLVNVMQFAPEQLEHPVVPLPRQRRIGAPTDITDRATDHHAFGQIGHCIAAMREQVAKEGLPQVFELERLAENLRLIERAAGGHRLEGLQEAAALRIIEEFGDRPWPRGVFEPAAHRVVLPEAQRRSEHRAHAFRTRQIDELRRAGGARQGGDRIGGAEIEAHCGGGRIGRNGRCLPGRWAIRGSARLGGARADVEAVSVAGR
jgi:hypothetical protein